MTVIDHVQRRRLVVEPNGWQIGLLGVANVNGGLVVSGLAGGKLRFQIAPVVGALSLLLTRCLARKTNLRLTPFRRSYMRMLFGHQ
jgi:hypothetical protein